MEKKFNVLSVLPKDIIIPFEIAVQGDINDADYVTETVSFESTVDDAIKLASLIASNIEWDRDDEEEDDDEREKEGYIKNVSCFSKEEKLFIMNLVDKSSLKNLKVDDEDKLNDAFGDVISSFIPYDSQAWYPAHTITDTSLYISVEF